MTAVRKFTWAHGLALLFAVLGGGLRTDAAWAGVSVLVVAWFVHSGPRLAVPGRRAALLFFCWLGAAALFSSDASASLRAFSRYALLGLLFFTAAAEPEGRRTWLRAVYFIGAAAAVTLLWQKLSGGWVIGLIGNNPNYSAAFCAAGFPAALLSAAPDGGRKEKIMKGMLALLLGAGILASGSRGAMLAAFAAAAAGLAVSRRWFALAVFAAAALGAGALLPREAWEGLLKLQDPRAFARPHLWGAALNAAAASPLLGWGPGLFGRAFELFKFPFFDGLSYYGHSTLHAHSELLNLAAEAGFPAALLFLAAAAGALLRRGGSLPLKLCALAVFLQSSIDMIFYSGAVALLFWGSLGFGSAEENSGDAPPRGRRVLAGFLLLAGLLLAPAMELAGARRPFFERAEAAAAGNPALALAINRRAALENPADPFLAEAEGRILASVNDLPAAEAAFSRALSLEPNFNRARLDLAALYAASGREAKACGLLSDAEKAPGVILRTPYLRGLAFYDRSAANKLKKKICGKKKTGGATAPGRRTR